MIREYFQFIVSTTISVFIIIALLSTILGFKAGMIICGFFMAVGVGYSIVWCTLCQIAQRYFSLNYFVIFCAGIVTIYIGDYFWLADKYGWDLTFDQHISVGLIAFPFGFLSSLILWFAFLRNSKSVHEG
ncbi:hypothetical protein ACMXYV_04920 [Neptuniibacter sp. SY11_33]|uniref:hypothetical protein n=1 Tax=Neptuniibacter sp. SY11_33 TaxID=3398215 RepID=UPI0039F58B3D